MGKWLPHDDYLLIQAVQQLSDLRAVYQCTRFSIKLTLKEIQERWYAILYDAPISRYWLVFTTEFILNAIFFPFFQFVEQSKNSNKIVLDQMETIKNKYFS